MTTQSRILVADDETHIVQVLSLKFRNAGFEVFEAHDGEEALELARRVRPDVVVTDYQMPFMNGGELAEALLKEPGLCEVPVMILTARGWGIDEVIASMPNVRHVQSKPFSPRAVLTMVEQMVDERSGSRKAA